ncbi:MAG: peptidylprolyl isomerase [Sphingomonas sp.]|nr:peptidylprolyl isomerase [Sphingomonas sp.]
MLGLGLVLAASPATARRGSGVVRVRIDTTLGAITVAVNERAAPATAANFLAYVDDGRFDGTNFYRAAQRKADPRFGFVQGGIQTDARRILPPFAFEGTGKTGLRHVDGAISMARHDDPKSAGGNYFICVGPIPSLDASATSRGYAVFGRVVAGMDVVRRILAAPTRGGSEVTRGQMLTNPVRVIRMVRLNGVAKPTVRPRQWLEKIPR